MKQKKSNSFIIYAAMFTLITAGSWAFFEVYRNLTKTTLTKVQQKLIQPIKVDVDQEVVDRLLIRRKMSDEELNSVVSKSTIELEDGGERIIDDTIVNKLNQETEATRSALVSPSASSSATATSSGTLQ